MARLKKQTKFNPNVLANAAKLVKAMFDSADDTVIFEVTGTPLVTRVFPDGTFKKLPARAREEMTLKNIRIGKRNEPIFVFEPVDAQGFVATEILLSDLTEVLKGFVVELNEALERAGRAGNCVSQEDVSQVFFSIALEIEEEERQAVAREERAKTKSMADKYGHLPNFGRF